MKRKILALTLLFCLITSTLMLPASAAESIAYTDIAGNPNRAAIERWSDLGILQGYEGKFRPSATITRGEMAVILDRLLKYKDAAKNTFGDLKDGEFYTDAVLKANKAGVILGDGKNIRPNGSITNEEVVVMLARALGIPAVKPTEGFCSDQDKISDWALPYAAAFCYRGYYTTSANAFNPQAKTSRAQFIGILDRIVGAVYNYKGTYNEKVNGSAVINSDNVTLSECDIKGDIIISPSVDVTTINYSNSVYMDAIGGKAPESAALVWSDRDGISIIPSDSAAAGHTYDYIIFRTNAKGIKEIAVKQTIKNPAPDTIININQLILDSKTGDVFTAVRRNLGTGALTKTSLPVSVTTKESSIGQVSLTLSDNNAYFMLNSIDVERTSGVSFTAGGSYYLSFYDGGLASPYAGIVTGSRISFPLLKDANLASCANKAYRLQQIEKLSSTSAGVEIVIATANPTLAPDLVNVNAGSYDISIAYEAEDGALYINASDLAHNEIYNLYFTSTDTFKSAGDMFSNPTAVKTFRSSIPTARVALQDILISFKNGESMLAIAQCDSNRFNISYISDAIKLSIKAGKIALGKTTLTAAKDGFYTVEVTLPDGIDLDEAYTLECADMDGVFFSNYAINRFDKKLIFTIPEGYLLTKGSGIKIHSISGLKLTANTLSYTLNSSEVVAVS